MQKFTLCTVFEMSKVDIGASVLASLPLGAVNLPGNVQRRRTDEDELQMRELYVEYFSNLIVFPVFRYL